MAYYTIDDKAGSSARSRVFVPLPRSYSAQAMPRRRRPHGSQHTQQTEQDKARDAFLEGYGYKVLRIPARDIGQAPAVVMARIAKALELDEQQWGSIEDTEHLKMYFKTD